MTVQLCKRVQRLVDVMIKDGLHCLTENPHHKRAKFVELTPKGKAIFQQLWGKQIPWANQCSEGISVKDLEVIGKLTHKLEG